MDSWISSSFDAEMRNEWISDQSPFRCHHSAESLEFYRNRERDVIPRIMPIITTKSQTFAVLLIWSTMSVLLYLLQSDYDWMQQIHPRE